MVPRAYYNPDRGCRVDFSMQFGIENYRRGQEWNVQPQNFVVSQVSLTTWPQQEMKKHVLVFLESLAHFLPS